MWVPNYIVKEFLYESTALDRILLSVEHNFYLE